MKIYLMRHGHAESHFTVSDAQRQLTNEGVKRVENAGIVLKRLQIAPAHIFCSPRVRAKQTADIVGNALAITIEVDEAVNFDFSADAVKDFVTHYGADGDLMFVGHEPTMSIVIAHLTGASVVMKPGSFARIDLSSVQPLRGDLLWLIAPKVFDALAIS